MGARGARQRPLLLCAVSASRVLQRGRDVVQVAQPTHGLKKGSQDIRGWVGRHGGGGMKAAGMVKRAWWAGLHGGCIGGGKRHLGNHPPCGEGQHPPRAATEAAPAAAHTASCMSARCSAASNQTAAWRAAGRRQRGWGRRAGRLSWRAWGRRRAWGRTCRSHPAQTRRRSTGTAWRAEGQGSITSVGISPRQHSAATAASAAAQAEGSAPHPALIACQPTTLIARPPPGCAPLPVSAHRAGVAGVALGAVG